MPASPNEETAASRAGQSLSEFIAKVLDQLSVSAWLPAALLVAVSWLLLALRANNANLSQALENMSAAGWPEFLILLGAVVLATTVAQAFAFEAIRILEGYWGAGHLGRVFGNSRCGRHRRVRNRRDEDLDKQKRHAFAAARTSMLAKGVARADVDAVEEYEFSETAEPAEREPDHDWRAFANPDDIRRMHTLGSSLANYPAADYRFLPTKLGNLLRSYEERAFGSAEEHLESVVSRIYHRLPPNLQVEHDEQRSRLDLYCTLVFISTVLGALALAALLHYEWSGVVGLVLGLGGSWFFYRAAIASAGGYGSVLMAMKPYLDLQQADQAGVPEVSSGDRD